MKREIVACLIVVVMMAFTSCVALPTEFSQSNSSEGSSSTVDFSEETEEVESSKEENDESSEEENTELAMGESATLGDWDISVTSWETVSEIPYSSGYFTFVPTEGNQYIVVSATVTNNGTSSNSFLPTFATYDDVTAKIYYNEKYEYSSSQLLGEDSDLHDSTLNPLTSKSGIIAYDVPPAVTEGTESLVITFEAGKESVSFKLR